MYAVHSQDESDLQDDQEGEGGPRSAGQGGRGVQFGNQDVRMGGTPYRQSTASKQRLRARIKTPKVRRCTLQLHVHVVPCASCVAEYGVTAGIIVRSPADSGSSSISNIIIIH